MNRSSPGCCRLRLVVELRDGHFHEPRRGLGIVAGPWPSPRRASFVARMSPILIWPTAGVVCSRRGSGFKVGYDDARTSGRALRGRPRRLPAHRPVSPTPSSSGRVQGRACSRWRPRAAGEQALANGVVDVPFVVTFLIFKVLTPPSGIRSRRRPSSRASDPRSTGDRHHWRQPDHGAGDEAGHDRLLGKEGGR